LKIEFLCPSRPKGPIVLNLQKNVGSDSFNVKENYVLKEGTINCLQLTFKVHNDIVDGLRYQCIVKKRGIQISKDEEVIGSFSPTREAHV
jgi:Rho GDP-dissociation inhibitor